MANEAVIIELGPTWGNVKRFTLASDATSISKGTILSLTDPDTVSTTATSGIGIAGIAAADRVPGEPLFVSCYTSGKFDCKASTDVISAGNLVALSGANLLRNAVAADLVNGAVVGKSRELASSGEVFAIDLMPGLVGA